MLTLSQIQKIQIPTNPGVYIYKTQKDNILYIGKAKNLKKRIGQYFSPGSVWKQDMLSQADKIERIKTETEQEALLLEENLIKEHQPEFNRLLKNNTQYVYIKITKEDFPQISIVRKKYYYKTSKNFPKSSAYNLHKSSIFIGPKNHTKNLKKFLSYIKSFYKLRDCNNTEFKKGKLCTKYDFGLCNGRCSNVIPAKAGIQSKSIQNYQQIISKIKDFFNGKTNIIKKELFKEIQKAINIQNFERANQLKEFYLELNDRTERQTIVLQKDISGIVGQISTINTKKESKNKFLGNTENKKTIQSGFYVFSIIKIVDGKIIDVIRGKEFIHEIDFSTLIQNIENEFDIKIDAKGREKTFVTAKNEAIQKNKEAFHFDNLDKKTSKKDFLGIKKFLSNSIQSFIASDSFQNYSIMNELLQQIQKKYFLKNFPYKIECIDISHFQGDRTSGGLSCLLGGLPYVKGYRRYKIKTSKNDDFKSIEEVLKRRFSIVITTKGESQSKKISENLDIPDLFIIDGGVGQLNIIKKIMMQNNNFIDTFSKVDFISLGKGEARDKNKINEDIVENIYLFDKNFNIINVPIEYNESDKIILKARDEAHRFANSYRKIQMKKERK